MGSGGGTGQQEVAAMTVFVWASLYGRVRVAERMFHQQPLCAASDKTKSFQWQDLN